MRDAVKNNMPLLIVMGVGAGLALSWLAGERDDRGPIGAAFLVTGGVWLYMTKTASTVASLHERFDETNVLLREIASSFRELASSQKEIASSQKEIAYSFRELASSFKDMSHTLTEISQKLDK